ncbi:oligosaccharide flippase family protein [Fictibacillus sp. NPDC058756]|uniref:putative polysaccharide biosynthesis protein n=1 Tax=Fictibacillus sp. NPDC058756 TaxID=3346625 RepID=UPI0036C0DCB7
MSKNTFIRGALILTIATFLSKFLGSVFRIPLQNIAGDDVLGIFSLVYPVYMTALILSVAGIPIAISKLISEARAKGEDTEIRNIFNTAGILAVIFGILSFSFLYGFSYQIAEILGGQETRSSLIVVSITLLIAPYMAVYRGFFQGYEDMKPTAYSQVIEQFIRVALVIVAAYYFVSISADNETIAAGTMAGSAIAALISLIFLRILFQKSKLKPGSNRPYTIEAFKKSSKHILKLSLPICVGALTMALLNVVDSLTIPSALKMAGNTAKETFYLNGIYARGTSLVQIATVFSTSIVLPLIPLITGKIAKNEMDQANRVIKRSFNLTHLFSWPAAVGIAALTLPLNIALFTNDEGSLVVAIVSFSSVFTSLAVLGTGILQGINRPTAAAIIIVAAAIGKVLLNFMLISQYGLIGAALATLIIYIVITVANALVIKQTFKLPFVNRSILTYTIGSLIMGAVIGYPTLLLDLSGRLANLLYAGVAIIIGGALFAVFILLTKGMTVEELQSLPVIGKKLGRFGRVSKNNA